MRRFGAVLVVVALATGAAACSSGSGGGSSAQDAPGGGRDGAPTTAEQAGLIPKAQWEVRQADYLTFAAARPQDGGRPLTLLAHAEADRLAGKTPDLSAASVELFEPMFEKLTTFQDTGDFDINELLTLYLRFGKDLPPKVHDAIEERLLGFKYWWTEPTPKGVIDSQYYWTENHQIIYLADEFVAGQAFPNTSFANSGMTGKQHMAHAKDRLATWFALRARFGFSEWLSNVYWTEDMKGLLLLAEFADDPGLAREASMMLDLLFVELAGHVERGTFGSTHGRTYQKDKLEGIDEDTFSIAKMVFDRTPIPYANDDNATLLAVAQRYRPPEVARKIAASDKATVFRLRAGLPLDPTAPVDPKVKAPYGLSFTGEKGLMAWWGMGAQFPWQVAPLSVDTVKKYDLFKTTNFKQASDLEPVVKDADDATVRNLAHSLAVQVNPGLLSQVNTYTWRSPGVMLSTAQDWRPGQRGEQDHISQVTMGPEALVFTQHPREKATSGDDPGNGGSFTGDGAMPRSAQDENVAVSVYAPQYDGGGGIGSGAYAFTYEPYTHAYFPTEKFDEVVQRAGWTLARKDDGFVALWSQRPTTWADHTGEKTTVELTKPYDLVARGGPDNVWITEVAQASDYAKAGDDTKARFDAFVDAITGAQIHVSRSDVSSCPTVGLCPYGPDAARSSGPDGGALVDYQSPSRGLVTFGWLPKEAGDAALPPLVVDGKTIDLHPEDLAWDAPYATAKWDSQVFHAELDGASLDLDFNKVTRRTTR
ncbi:MAG: hypothetical protein JWM89_1513 [Acidimicrobiales bacterium]|nr:hypothetical protein [Acidimicrobiales bacterium]